MSLEFYLYWSKSHVHGGALCVAPVLCGLRLPSISIKGQADVTSQNLRGFFHLQEEYLPSMCWGVVTKYSCLAAKCSVSTNCYRYFWGYWLLLKLENLIATLPPVLIIKGLWIIKVHDSLSIIVSFCRHWITTPVPHDILNNWAAADIPLTLFRFRPWPVPHQPKWEEICSSAPQVESRH